MKEKILRMGVCVVAGVILGATASILTGNSEAGIMIAILSSLIISTSGRK